MQSCVQNNVIYLIYTNQNSDVTRWKWTLSDLA